MKVPEYMKDKLIRRAKYGILVNHYEMLKNYNKE